MDGIVYPVILSGGTGTRLWPMSRTLRPKQLMALTAERTMLQETVARVTAPGFAPPTILCNEEHRFMIAEQLRELGATAEAIILEPAARNTAPAITVAALFLAEKDPDAVMLVLPSDHVVEDAGAFRDLVAAAAEVARRGVMVTFGITPSRPESGYGYIRRGAPMAGAPNCYHIERFVEKPDTETARAYLASGEYSWNSGMFVFPVATYLAEVGRLRAELVEHARAALAAAASDLDFLRLAREPFAAMPAVSVDYAVMEQTDKGAIIPADIGWSDVGSWDALWEIGARDESANVTLGDVIAVDVERSYLRGDRRLVAAIGVRDLVVVASDDAVLVVPRARAQEVKAVVERIERSGRTEHYVHPQVFRPWGWYQAIDAGPRYQVKQIVVHPGHQLSSQMHYHRAEHWVVVSGTARVERGNETFFLTEDQSTYIPHNVRHSLGNPGQVPLRLIEVQSGGYLGEDDIVRFDDRYGRAPAEEGE